MSDVITVGKVTLDTDLNELYSFGVKAFGRIGFNCLPKGTSLFFFSLFGILSITCGIYIICN